MPATKKAASKLSLLLDTVMPYHLGKEILFVCKSIEDAKSLYLGLCQSIELLTKIFTSNLKIVCKNQVLYLVSISNDLQLDPTGLDKGKQMVATIEQVSMTGSTTGSMFNHSNATNIDNQIEWEQFIQNLAVVSNSSTEAVRQEIFSMPLNAMAVNAITSNFFTNRLARVNQQPPSEPLNGIASNGGKNAIAEPAAAEEVPPESDTSENGSNQQREILKSQGLPVQYGGIKSLVPVPPPTRVTEASRAKELDALKDLLKKALIKLNKGGQKHFYVLDHLSRETEAGKIYLAELVKLHDFVDTKPKQKEERADKIVAAANALIAEMFPGKAAEPTGSADDQE